ncbi:inosine-5'-monophosphate dehydrogenase 1-like [Vitis riparia]|uniref:inosine-5'-monophosphate dehydrogenase 1-like n=1 Tax=Vitis riparia TaxID=96939 RepID=UPI00155AA369|nr:inosine-5'-monophosphate dehydrogenase 1-like [Vitis riparia]
MKFCNFWCGRRHGRSSHRRQFSSVQLGAKLNRDVHLSMPCVASPMDTVTEPAMATVGGVIITHSSNSAAEGAALVQFLQVAARSFRAGSICEARVLFGGFDFRFQFCVVRSDAGIGDNKVEDVGSGVEVPLEGIDGQESEGL